MTTGAAPASREPAQAQQRRPAADWGPDDQYGALNLVTPEKIRRAMSLVTIGQSVCLSRPFPTTPGRANPLPAQHYMMRLEKGPGTGAAADYIGGVFHGTSWTHVDALCHMWNSEGMWNGRDPDTELDFAGTRWGGIEHWRTGIITRGVLLDIPALRDARYVTPDEPVRAADLRAAATRQGVAAEPGDALVVYSGRDGWDAENPPWGSSSRRPGLDPSCLDYLRQIRCAALAWDMMDALPAQPGQPLGVHGAIPELGVALIDNAELADLVALCRAAGCYEFLFIVAPLVVLGGTGSPVTPLAVL
jgi:kynurenine formamidase